MRFHVDMEAARLVRERSLDRDEASRRAAVAFGGIEQYKEVARDVRGLRWARSFSLDFKLGFRMLVKYPGLTVVGGLAMAFGVAAGAGVFEFITQYLRPTLPFRDAERIVGISIWDQASAGPRSPSLDDFVAWRDGLTSLVDLGAARKVDRNLIREDGAATPVEVAEISASAFRVTGVSAFLGRTLLPADEDAAAPSVIVLGHDLWQARFSGDRRVIGQSVRLGDGSATVVGVMPAGFAFPVAHSVWAPLRPDRIVNRHHPSLIVFGRIANGVSRRQAEAEAATIGVRSPEDASRRRRLRPEVLPYAESVMPVRGMMRLGVYSINAFLVLFMALVAGNVGLLMFARAATRESEIVLRTALGASRGRILTQLFIEALVLGSIASIVGLVGADFLVGQWIAVVRESGRVAVPFWFRDSLAPITVFYAVLLMAFGAAIAGVLPVLKLTRGLAGRLRAHTMGGHRFGVPWTVVIVAQVAMTVAFPVMAYVNHMGTSPAVVAQMMLRADRYLTTRLETDRGVPSTVRSLADLRAQLAGRLAREPGVVGVTFANRLPGMRHPYRQLEADDAEGGMSKTVAPRVTNAAVDPDYFDVLGVGIRMGRAFQPADVAGDARVAIVNESFVRDVLGDRQPIGRRVRYLDCAQGQPGGPATGASCPWFEIVGVVSDLGMMTGEDVPTSSAGVYHPLPPATADPVYMAVHVNGDPRSFADRVRAVAASVDPGLRLYSLLPLTEIRDQLLFQNQFWFRLLIVVSAVAVLLSLSGVYAVMAFAVARRTREIGIRVALGAERGRVVATILAQPLMQLGGGIAAGGVLVTAIVRSATGDAFSARDVALVGVYATVMLGVCLLACIVPTRRGLRVEPMVALRSE